MVRSASSRVSNHEAPVVAHPSRRRARARLLRMRSENVEKRTRRMSNTNSPVPEDRIPVIVGAGEIVDRPKEITAGLEPLDLLEQALKRAETDSGCKLLG